MFFVARMTSLFCLFLTIEPFNAGPWCVSRRYQFLVFFIGNEQAIAVHAFCVLVLRWRAPKYISKLVVLIIWIFITLVIVIPYSIHRNQRFYGDAGGYCTFLIF